MSLAAAARSAAAHFEVLTASVRAYGEAAQMVRRSAAVDRDEAAAVRRGLRPELVEAYRQALGLKT